MSTVDENKKWTFPDVRYLVEENLGGIGFNYQIKMHEEKIDELTVLLAEKQNEIDQLRNEFQVVSSKCNEIELSKVGLLENFKKSIDKLNDSISQDAVKIIKTIAKRLILRELTVNDETIKNILNNILSKIQSDGCIQVDVSPNDFNTLSGATFDKPLKLNRNENLETGDIIVSCNTGSLMLKIDEAIDLILGA